MPLGTLPSSAKKLWESVYQESKKAGDKTEIAARKAWGAVRGAGYKKVKGKWTKKSELVEMSMYITKASINNGTMTWAAVNSDTDYDSYGERMSVELYKNFIENIKSENVPDSFKKYVCSEYWCGGMPYLSVSHYPDLNGKAVPGETLEIYVDGNKLKAKGILFDNALGHAVWRSLKEDKDKNTDEKIRISIGFLDMAHKHGENGTPFIRDGEFSLCHECLNGTEDKIYLKGHLVHLALTRVPVNKRTEMVLEEKSEMAKKKTRKEDAASIVGESLAEEIEVKNKTIAKSDILIEMSESESEEETQELIEEIESSGGTPAPVADAVVEPVTETVEEIAEAVEEKSETFEDDTMSKVAEQPEKYNDDYPLNGATSMKDAEEYISAQKEMSFVLQAWEVFSTVAWNIIQREDITNKKEMFMGAVDEFRNLLSVKSMAVFSVAEKEEVQEHELQPAIDALLSTVDNSIERSDVERAEALNPMLQNLGSAIMDYLTKKSVVEQPVPHNENKDNLLADIEKLIQPLSERLSLMAEEVNTLKSQTLAKDVKPEKRIPQPRTAVLPPSLLQKSEVVNKSATPKLRDIVNRSVGL